MPVTTAPANQAAQQAPTQTPPPAAAQDFAKAVQDAKASQPTAAEREAEFYKQKAITDGVDPAVAQRQFGTVPVANGASPVAAVDNSRSATITVPGDTSSPAISVSGGAWPTETPGTLTALGAAPQVPPGQLQTSADDAAKLASGTSVETLVAAGRSTASINGAFELLGISDRQISLYAEAAAKGGVGKDQQIFGTLTWTPDGTTAFNALKSAAQMRAAASETGAQDIAAGKPSGAVFSPVPGFSPPPLPQPGGLPAQLGVTGVRDAVDAGVTRAGVYSYPGFVADGMLHGSGGIYINKAISPGQSAFGGRDAGAATGAVARGEAKLQSSAVLLGVPTTQGADLLPQAGNAAVRLSKLAQSGTEWTPTSATEAFYAADTLMQGIAPLVDTQLRTDQSALGVGTGAQTSAELASAHRTAVDEVLQSRGIKGIDAQTIGQVLLSAAASPAFEQAIGGSQESANSAYATMASFDPQSVQRLALVQNYNQPSGLMPSGVAPPLGRKMLQSTLQSMAANPAPAPGAVPTMQQKEAAGLVAGQWSAASARWFLAGTSKAGGAVDAAIKPKLDRYQTLIQSAVETVKVSIGAANPAGVNVGLNLDYQYQGQSVGKSVQEVQAWAARESGLGASKDFMTWLGGAGADTAKFIDRTGLPVVGAVASAAVRSVRLAEGGMTSLTRAQAAAGIAADAMVATEWATQPQRLGQALTNGLVAIENAVLPDAAVNQNLASFARMMDGLPQIPPSPTTRVGQFLDTVTPQLGGVANLLYGGFNFAQGIVSLTKGQAGTGTLQLITGSVDFVNGLSQLANAAGAANPAWQNINNFGGYYTPPLQAATRFVAAAGGAALAGING